MKIKEIKNNLKDKVAESEVRKHLVRNKERYIWGTVLVASNVVIYILKSGHEDGDHYHIGASQTADNEGSNIIQQARTIENHTHNYDPVTRQSYIVRDGEDFWLTQGEYALDTGQSPRDVSRWLNHGIPLRSGREPERVGARGAE